jgi:hypothetical protein
VKDFAAGADAAMLGGVTEQAPETEAVPALDGVPVNIRPGTAEGGEGWLSSGSVARAARLAVGAWLTAVDGDDSALRALAGPARPGADGGRGAADDLLYPPGRDWVIAPGPEVIGIAVRRVDAGSDVPELGLQWRFTGAPRYGGPVIPPGWTPPGDREFSGSAYLTLDESRPLPWRLTSAGVETQDDGYSYTARDETPAEYQDRTGLTVRPAALVPGATYRLLASYVEHSYEFSGDAKADLDRDTPLTRDEAGRLAADAVGRQARSRAAALSAADQGEADVDPALTMLRVIRLLDAAPAVEPATGTDGPAVDDFARRYGASRALASPGERGPAWRDPGPWFLGPLNLALSRGLLSGGVGGGRSADIWFAQGPRRGRGRSREQWVVARSEIGQARRSGGIAVAVRRQRGLGRGGPPRGLTGLPCGLTEVAAEEGPLAQRYVVAAAGGDRGVGERSWASRLLTDEFSGWLLEQPYGDRGADATCFQLQGGLLCVYAAGWPLTAGALDAFRERAARITAAVESAARLAVE